MIYKKIKGFEDLYLVSEYGEIIRLPKKVNSVRSSSGKRILSKKKLKIQTNKYGYNYTQLTDKNGNRKHYFIHQLVALNFLENPNNYTSINHKDEDKTNNHYSNLEWRSVRYNNLYNNRQSKINKKLQNSVKTRKPIIQYNKEGVLVEEFQSINEACRLLGIFKQGISRCLNNKQKYYKGFIWKFKE